MDLNGLDFAVIAVLVGVGCALGYIGLWFMLHHAAAERQQATEDQLSALADALKVVEARLAALGQPAAAPAVEAAATVEAAQQEMPREDEQVSPETLVIIAAAVTAFLGKKVRIRSAKRLRPSHEGVSAWAQQGRVFAHGSHNLRMRG